VHFFYNVRLSLGAMCLNPKRSKTFENVKTFKCNRSNKRC